MVSIDDALSFEDSLRLRQAILDYTGELNDTQLRALRTPKLIAYLQQNGFPGLTPEQIENSLFGESLWSPSEPYFVPSLSWRITNEDNSLDRLEKLLGKKVLEMNDEELKAAALEMLILTIGDYEKTLAREGIAADDRYGHEGYIDRKILLEIIGKKGIPYSRKELRQDILQRDYGLGYFENSFKSAFAYFTDGDNPDSETGDLREVLGREYHRFQEKLGNHLVFDARLKAQHTIKAPELLPEETLVFNGFRPYAIEFDSCGSLFVLGYKVIGDDGPEVVGEDERPRLSLKKYNPKRKEILREVQTRLSPKFDGTAFGMDSFQGSLTIGSDGIIYVNGGAKRYNLDLGEITDNESGFKDALSLIAQKNLFSWNDEVFQVLESEGVFYFAIQPSSFPKCYNNKLVAATGKQLIGKPLMDYSPSGGSSHSGDDETPRMVLHGDSLFFKDNKKIILVGKGLSQKDWDNRHTVIDSWSAERPGLDYIPSKHCISPGGILYVASGLPDEPAQSIKGYDLKSGSANFATHFYPEDFPGGWAAMRSMAISGDGVLAYTSLGGQLCKIHFYKLEK